MLRSRKWCAPLRGDLRFPKVVLAPCLTPASAKEYRSLEVKHEFQRQHPCPSTGSPTSRCPVYIKDHVVPLACGGPDAVSNLQWQTIRAARAKDKWERKSCGR
jgi:hypothetical protein